MSVRNNSLIIRLWWLIKFIIVRVIITIIVIVVGQSGCFTRYLPHGFYLLHCTALIVAAHVVINHSSASLSHIHYIFLLQPFLGFPVNKALIPGTGAQSRCDFQRLSRQTVLKHSYCGGGRAPWCGAVMQGEVFFSLFPLHRLSRYCIKFAIGARARRKGDDIFPSQSIPISTAALIRTSALFRAIVSACARARKKGREPFRGRGHFRGK